MNKLNSTSRNKLIDALAKKEVLGDLTVEDFANEINKIKAKNNGK